MRKNAGCTAKLYQGVEFLIFVKKEAEALRTTEITIDFAE